MIGTTHSTLPELSLRANFSWTLAGNLVYAGCQWGMLVVLAKLGSPEMVGQFALGLAVTAPIMLFANLQLRGIQVTDARREYQFGDYLRLRLITTLLALLAIAGIALASGYRWETTLVIIALGIAKAIESISDIFYGLLQQHERMDRIAKSMMIKGALSLGILSAGVYATGSVMWGAAGLAAAWATILACYDIPNGILLLRRTPQPSASAHTQARTLQRWDRAALAKLVWMALPLGLVMLLISLNTNIPRYFIERYQGVRELGIFAALAYLIVAGNTVASALGQSASSRLAKYYAAGDNPAFRNLLLKLAGIGALMGAVGILAALVAGRSILTLLYRPEYAAYVDVFVLLVIDAGLGFVASFLGYGMSAARYFRIQLPLFILVTGAAVLMCIFLVPSQGLYGAAIALIISSIVQLIGSLAIIAHALRALQRHAGQ